MGRWPWTILGLALCGILVGEAGGWQEAPWVYGPDSSPPRFWQVPADPYRGASPGMRSQAGYDGAPMAAGVPAYGDRLRQGYDPYGGYRFRPLTRDERLRQGRGPSASGWRPSLPAGLPSDTFYSQGHRPRRPQAASWPFLDLWQGVSRYPAYGFRPRGRDNSSGEVPQHLDADPAFSPDPKPPVEPLSTDLWILPGH